MYCLFIKGDEVICSIELPPLHEGVEEERGAARWLRLHLVKAAVHVDVDLLHPLREGLEHEALAAGGRRVEALDRRVRRGRHGRVRRRRRRRRRGGVEDGGLRGGWGEEGRRGACGAGTAGFKRGVVGCLVV